MVQVFINSCCQEASNLQRQLSPAERVYPAVSVTAVQELAARSSWRSMRASLNGIVFVHSIPGPNVLRHGQEARDMPRTCTIKNITIKPRSKANQASGLGGSVGRWCAWQCGVLGSIPQ